MELGDLLDIADANIRRMREDDDLERLMGLTGLQQVMNVIRDRQRATSSFAVPEPTSGLAKVIQDAMWDDNSNRIGGPRTAAAAVEQYLAANANSRTAHGHQQEHGTKI